MAQIKLTPLEDVLDDFYGKVGTPKRDEHERKVEEALHAYRIGEAIKAERKEKHITQEELAQLMGVKKSQVSRIENGKNPTISTIVRAFRALGMAVSLTFGDKQIALD